MFKTLQKIGKAFMLPIAILPAAGLLLGIGGALSMGEVSIVINMETKGAEHSEKVLNRLRAQGYEPMVPQH